MTRNFRSLSLFTLCGLGACAAAPIDSAEPEVFAPGAGPASQGAPAQDAWLTEVSARIGARSRAMHPLDSGGFAAPMPRARASARVDAAGLRLERHGAALDVRLESIGRGDERRALDEAAPEEGGCLSDIDPAGQCIRSVERSWEGVTEWWIGLDGGVEQGFTLSERPFPGDAPLQLELGVSGALDLDTDGQQAWLTDAEGGTWTVGDLAAWDANGEPLPVHFEADGDALRMLVDDAGATYPVTVDPVYSTAATILVGTQGTFGYAVVGIGDYNGDSYDDVVVTDPWYSSSSGRAYLFRGGANGLSTTQSLSMGTSGNFGASASGAGDVDGDGKADFLVGAPNYQNSGMVRVCYSNGSTTDDTVSNSVEYGHSVAGIGDINGDGYDDIAVGDPAYSSSRGRVHIFRGSSRGINFSSQSTLDTLTGTSANDELGDKVVALGDVNGDTYADFAVSAPGYGTSGGVYIYVGGPNGASRLGGISSHGTEVDGAGDVNGDGYDDVAIGNPTYNNGWGKVYVHYGQQSGQLSSFATLSGSASSRDFGETVAGIGDINGDGYGDLAISDEPSTASYGYVYIMHGSASGPSSTGQQSITGGGYFFGNAIDSAGDVNGDQVPDLIIGNPDSSGPPAAYVYLGYTDHDLDGVAAADDCDDNDASTGEAVDRFVDDDGDGWGDSNQRELVCPGTGGYSDVDGDCDDSDAAINYGATEGMADGVDQNCDGQELCYRDYDGDGAHHPTAPITSRDLDCADAGESDGGGQEDCDDDDASAYPGAAEGIDDGIDQDCDGNELCYTDADSDGFRSDVAVHASDLACGEPGLAPTEMQAGDCDDDNGEIHPNAIELPGDAIDQNCDGGETCYADADDDGFRPNETAAVGSDDTDCDDAGEALGAESVGDCDDSEAAAYPGGAETPSDGVDGDCDGAELCYIDEDGDGYAIEDTRSSTNLSCTEAGLGGMDAPPTDCNDSVASVNPSVAEEPGDGIDQDCNGSDELASEDGGDTKGNGGCSSTGGAPATGLLGLFALLFSRRRR